MRSGSVTFLFLFASFVLQTTLFSQFFFLLSRSTGIVDFASQRFDFVFIAIVYLSLHRSRSSAMIWAVIASFLANSFGLAWQGAFSFSLISLAFLVSLLKGRVMLTNMSSVMVLVALSTLLEAILHLSVGKLFHGNSMLFWGQAGHVFRHVILQTLVAPVVFSMLKTLDLWTGAMQERRAFPLTQF